MTNAASDRGLKPGPPNAGPLLQQESYTTKYYNKHNIKKEKKKKECLMTETAPLSSRQEVYSFHQKPLVSWPWPLWISKSNN